MGARFRSWWQKRHKLLLVTGIIALLVVVGVLVWASYAYKWSAAGFANKRVWDWLQLLVIPFALAIIAILFNRAERKNEQRVASDNQQEAALQEYIKEMSELLLHGKLRESQPGDEVQTIARVRTLTVLTRLNKERKNSVLQFLYESGLIAKDKSLVRLYGANFSKIDLFDAVLREADLSRTTLIEANLSRTFLQGTNLEWADLTRAVLSISKLNRANLSDISPSTISALNRRGRAYMNALFAGMASYTSENQMLGISLGNATLTEADLRGTNLTQVDLNNSYLIKTKLQGANLSGANLSKAILIEASLQHANLSGANLQHALLVKAKLQMTKLINANLQEADLYGANLRGADLTKADLSRANLAYANLERAIVTPEQLKTADTLRYTTMPDGSIHPK